MAAKWADGPFPLIATPEFSQKIKGTPDQYVRGASIMALVHNSIIRGLNSIYLQAPHVEPEDYKDFIAYCYCWYQYIDSHHRGEEENLFPKLEEISGEKGLMEESVEQHKAFEAGLEAYKTYLLSLNGQENEFSAAKLTSIVDSFSPALMAHLAEEIPTILSLARFGSKVPLLKLAEVEMRKASDEIPKTEGLPIFMLNLDRTFENGIWESWPPIPAAIRWGLIRVVAWKHTGWWRFASCDYDGYPKKLHAMA